MFQNKINETLALGIPGEFANTNLRRVDAVVVGTAVTMGANAAMLEGEAVPASTSGATLVKGVYVSTHQMVALNGPNDAYAATLEVPAGSEVAVATMGDVFVEATLATAGTVPAFGEPVYYTATGITLDSTATGAVQLGTVVLAPYAVDATATTAVIGVRIG